MKRVTGAFLLLACLVPIAALAPANPSAVAQVSRQAVDDVFAAYDHTDTPGCALGVVQGGELVYARGYGMANLDHGIAITPQTVFRIGSVSKQFTAAAVAIAAREGLLSPDDPVRKWIPELPTYPSDPTVRHMVHHTSGLRDYLTLMDLKGLRNDDFYTDAQVREVLSRQRELNFTPATDFLYSNSGYFLLGEVIRAATGMSLRQYAEEKIFAPLGMRHSHFHDDHDHIVPLRATGYAPRDDGYRVSVTTLDMVGDGGVFTSIEDLVHWVNALRDDSLSSGLTATLETRGVLAGGNTIPYAFGQEHGEYRGLPTIAHGGAFVGYRADITRFPAQDTAIMTLCNRADAGPSRLALRVADVVLAAELAPSDEAESRPDNRREARPEPGPVTEIDDYVGSYYSPELDVVYTLTRDGDGLRLRAGQGIDGRLDRTAPDVLVLRGLTLRFVRAGGDVTGFALDAGRVRHLAFERRDRR